MSSKFLLVLLLAPLSLWAQDYDTTRERHISFSQSLNHGNKFGLELRKQMVQRPIYLKYSIFTTESIERSQGMPSRILKAVPEYQSDSSFALRRMGAWSNDYDARVGMEYFRQNGVFKLIVGLDAIGGLSRRHFTETIMHYEMDNRSSNYVAIEDDELYEVDNVMRVDRLKLGLAPSIGVSVSASKHLSCLLFVRNEAVFLSPLSSKVVEGQTIESEWLNTSATSLNSLFYIDVGLGYRF